MNAKESVIMKNSEVIMASTTIVPPRRGIMKLLGVSRGTVWIAFKLFALGCVRLGDFVPPLGACEVAIAVTSVGDRWKDLSR
jgi:hypothetical protein